MAVFVEKILTSRHLVGSWEGGGEGALGRKSKENHFRNGGKTLRAAVETKTSQTQNTQTQKTTRFLQHLFVIYYKVRKIGNSWDNVADWLPGNLFWILCKTFETGENFSWEAFTKLDLEIQRYPKQTYHCKHILRYCKNKYFTFNNRLLVQEHKLLCVIWSISIKV